MFSGSQLIRPVCSVENTQQWQRSLRHLLVISSPWCVYTCWQKYFCRTLFRKACICNTLWTGAVPHFLHISSPSFSFLHSLAPKPTKDYASLYCVASGLSGCFSKNPISWLHSISGQSTVLNSCQEKTAFVVHRLLLSTSSSTASANNKVAALIF